MPARAAAATALAVLVALSLASGCGSTDNAGPASTTTSSSAPATSRPRGTIGPADEAWCSQLQQRIREDSTKVSNPNDPADRAKALELYKAQISSMAATAPEEIRAQWATVDEALQKKKTLDELYQPEEPAVEKANTAVRRWVSRNCGFNLFTGS